MTRMSSSEALVETLLAHGVKHIFGIVGSAYMDALDLFPREHCYGVFVCLISTIRFRSTVIQNREVSLYGFGRVASLPAKILPNRGTVTGLWTHFRAAG